MGSKYSSELKQDPNHVVNVASTSFSKVNHENAFETSSIFHLLGCWKCICFKPRNLKAAKSRISAETLNNNNNRTSDEVANKNGNENLGMQFKCNDEENFSSGRAEIYRNVAPAESGFDLRKSRGPSKQLSFENKRTNVASATQRTLGYARRSASLKSCFGSSIGSSSDVKKNFLSRLASLSVDCKQRLGYVKQIDSAEPSGRHDFKNCDKNQDDEEDKNERDELLDHGRYSFDERLDFLRPVDSMDYLDSTPSTEDKFTEACLKFQNRKDNLSSELYEESCSDNLDSFCDKSILLASMDTIDLGSSIESLVPTSLDNDAFDRSPSQDLEGCVILDVDTYRSLMDDLLACKQILKQLEALVSDVRPSLQEMLK